MCVHFSYLTTTFKQTQHLNFLITTLSNTILFTNSQPFFYTIFNCILVTYFVSHFLLAAYCGSIWLQKLTSTITCKGYQVYTQIFDDHSRSYQCIFITTITFQYASSLQNGSKYVTIFMFTQLDNNLWNNNLPCIQQKWHTYDNVCHFCLLWFHFIGLLV